MPYKHNARTRHKFKKSTYKVTNWTEYNEALRRRGDVTIWFTAEAMKAWVPEKTGGRGRPKNYSDIAIETCLFLRLVFSLPLRQTEGFAKSLVQLMQLELDVPDYSTLSKRSIALKLSHLAQTLTPGSHVIVDSTGLKVYGKSEWQQEKHRTKAKRTWRKLHIAIDEKHQIIAWDITPNSTGDTTGAYDLLAQVEHEFTVVMGDGAHDSFHFNEAILRYKKIIGPDMKARELPQQKTEGAIAVRALNRMTSLGMPTSVKVK